MYNLLEKAFRIHISILYIYVGERNVKMNGFSRKLNFIVSIFHQHWDKFGDKYW